MRHGRILIPVLFATCVAAVWVTGCSWEKRVVGVVEFYNDPVVIEVPDTVDVSTPFLVSIRTYGGGCETRGPTELTMAGQTARITPYDFTRSGINVACTLILNTFEHEASVTFESAGPATVLVRGRVQATDEVREFGFPVWVR